MDGSRKHQLLTHGKIADLHSGIMREMEIKEAMVVSSNQVMEGKDQSLRPQNQGTMEHNRVMDSTIKVGMLEAQLPIYF